MTAEPVIPSSATTLARVPALVGRYDELIEGGRAEGSPALNDAHAPIGRSVFELATAAWLSGGDNLLAAHHLRLRAAVQMPSATYTLLRGALEGAVTCRWLLDPSATADKRRHRAAAAQLEDLEERRKFEESIKAPPFVPPAKSGADRAADLRRLLVLEGIVAADADRDPRTMAMTDRFKLYALLSGRDGSWLYRVLSAFAHGMQWQLAAFGEIVERIEEPSGDGLLIKLTARDGPIDGATIVAYLALERALQELTWYMGRGPKPRLIKLRGMRW